MRNLRLTRGRIGALTAAAAGVTTAVTMLAVDVPAHATTTQNWAAGVTAKGTVLNIPATPLVTSGTKSLASMPSNQGGLTGSLLTASAGAGSAKATVAEVKIGNQLAGHLLKASCQGGSGSADVGSLMINGKSYSGSAPANTVIPPAQSGSPLTVTLNKQVSDGHGGMEVSALEVSLKLPGSPVAQKVDLSTAYCSAAGGNGSGSTPSAPAPAPQQGTLPVTG